MNWRAFGGTALLVFACTQCFMVAAGASEPEENPSVDGEYTFDPGELDLDLLLLEDDFALLYAEDTVVSATRRAQRISESPATITVIHRDEILDGGYRDIADVMRTVPGAMVYRFNPMSVTVGIRSGTTSVANLVLVLVDGRDQGLHLTGQPQWNSLPMDLESIERIEIIRGPGSSIYGANALQGVVNIITRRPGDDPWTAEATLSPTSLETFGGDLRVHGRYGGLRWWTNAGYDREAFFQRPEENGYQSRRVRGWMSLELSEGLEGRIDAGYSDAAGWFVAPAGDGAARWSTGYFSARLRAPASEVQLSLEAGNGQFSPETMLVAEPLSAGQDPLKLGTFQPTGVASTSAELTAWHSIDLAKNNTLMVGVSGRFIHHGTGALLVCPQGVLPADFELSDCEELHLDELRGGLFVQDEWAIGERLILTLGGRLDTNNLHPGWGVSPRVALVFAPARNHALRTSFGSAYRKPSYIEAYNSLRVILPDDVPGDLGRRLQHLFAVLLPNHDLQNEKMSALELGWSARLLDGRLNAAVDLFGARFDGRISGVIDANLEPGFGGVPRLGEDASVSFVNSTEPGWAYGGEISANMRIFTWLRVKASYSYQHLDIFEEKDGAIVRIDEIWNPEHRLHLGARMNHRSGLGAGVDAHAYSRYRRYIQDPESALLPEIEQDLGETVLMMAALSYSFAAGKTKIEAGLRGSNLLGLPIRELPNAETPARTFGGEELPRRFTLFLRGSF